MSIINAELKHSKKTVGQIATQYSVSKERIEAIRKLKRVEEEYWFHVSFFNESAIHSHSSPPLDIDCDRSLVYSSDHAACPSTSSLMRNMTRHSLNKTHTGSTAPNGY